LKTSFVKKDKPPSVKQTSHEAGHSLSWMTDLKETELWHFVTFSRKVMEKWEKS